jgi:hypothetical protein
LGGNERIAQLLLIIEPDLQELREKKIYCAGIQIIALRLGLLRKNFINCATLSKNLRQVHLYQNP